MEHCDSSAHNMQRKLTMQKCSMTLYICQASVWSYNGHQFCALVTECLRRAAMEQQHCLHAKEAHQAEVLYDAVHLIRLPDGAERELLCDNDVSVHI